MKVAVVHNTNPAGVVNRYGQQTPEHYNPKTIQLVVDSLAAAGQQVASIEGDKHLFAALESFMPPDAEGHPTGMVFNMAYGIQGENRYTHLPAMLELAGVPYTGSTPMGHALALDKVVTKVLALEAGVPTPAFRVMRSGDEPVEGLRFPLIVKPRHESTSFGLALVETREQLQQAVQRIVLEFEQDALVEEYIDGREVTIGLLGSEEVEFLPAVELDFTGRDLRMNTLDDKSHRRHDEPGKICPAPLEGDLLARLQQIALATFRACHLRDYARVDLRLDRQGEPYMLEVNSMASLSASGSFVTGAMAAGYTFETLVGRICDLAWRRVARQQARDAVALELWTAQRAAEAARAAEVLVSAGPAPA